MSCRKAMVRFRQLTKERKGRIVTLAGIEDHSSKALQHWVKESVKTPKVAQHVPWLLSPQPRWEVGKEGVSYASPLPLPPSLVWRLCYHVGIRQDSVLIKKGLPESLCRYNF